MKQKTVNSSKKNKKETDKKNIKKYLTKENIIYSIIILIDIAIIIYFARKNIINYVTIENRDPIYLGNKHNLYFGRNYITLFTTLIVYIYIIVLNKVYLKKEIRMKNLILFFISILILNCIIFYMFTIKVY